MSDAPYRPEKRKVTMQDIDSAPLSEDHPMYGVQQTQDALTREGYHADPATSLGGQGFEIKGNIPPAFAEALRKHQQPRNEQPFEDAPEMAPPPQQPRRRQESHDASLEEIIQKLDAKTQVYDEVLLPSRGKFYTGQEAPTSGVIHIRPMTGAEEQILGTSRYVKRGKALDMIFERCIRENIQADKLLSVDRTFLLIYLRGISYTPQYDVEIKCPQCGTQFGTTIDLNALEVDECPDSYGPEQLTDVLPTSGLEFTYRLGCGGDEAQVAAYRERMAKEFGDNRMDDTMSYRTSILLEELAGIRDKVQLKVLANKLPINDLNYIRNLVNEPPFGVNTQIDLQCPSCLAEFDVDLPLESSFFFPRRKKGSPKT